MDVNEISFIGTKFKYCINEDVWVVDLSDLSNVKVVESLMAGDKEKAIVLSFKNTNEKLKLNPVLAVFAKHIADNFFSGTNLKVEKKYSISDNTAYLRGKN